MLQDKLCHEDNAITWNSANIIVNLYSIVNIDLIVIKFDIHVGNNILQN